MHVKITRENVLIGLRTHSPGDVINLPDDRARSLLALGVAEEAAAPGAPEPSRAGPARHVAPESALRRERGEQAVSRKP